MQPTYGRNRRPFHCAPFQASDIYLCCSRFLRQRRRVELLHPNDVIASQDREAKRVRASLADTRDDFKILGNAMRKSREQAASSEGVVTIPVAGYEITGRDMTFGPVSTGVCQFPRR